MVELDFQFHHLIALASGNLIYPLVLNSFRELYTNLAAQFFSDTGLVPVVFEFHRRLGLAVKTQNAPEAQAVMARMLAHGEKHLQALYGRTETENTAFREAL